MRPNTPTPTSTQPTSANISSSTGPTVCQAVEVSVHIASRVIAYARCSAIRLAKTKLVWFMKAFLSFILTRQPSENHRAALVGASGVSTQLYAEPRNAKAGERSQSYDSG